MESAHRYFRIGAPLILEWTHQSTGICKQKGLFVIGVKDYLKKIVFQLSDTLKWVKISGYCAGENFELKQENRAERVIYQNDDFSV